MLAAYVSTSRHGVARCEAPVQVWPVQYGRTAHDVRPGSSYGVGKHVQEGGPVSDDQHWTAYGACGGLSPDDLFVEGAAQRSAREVCLRCPVRLECLVDALDHRIAFGVWGGLTERERRALLRGFPDVESWRELLASDPSLGDVAGVRPEAVGLQTDPAEHPAGHGR